MIQWRCMMPQSICANPIQFSISRSVGCMRLFCNSRRDNFLLRSFPFSLHRPDISPAPANLHTTEGGQAAECRHPLRDPCRELRMGFARCRAFLGGVLPPNVGSAFTHLRTTLKQYRGPVLHRYQIHGAKLREPKFAVSSIPLGLFLQLVSGSLLRGKYKSIRSKVGWRWPLGV